MLFRSTVVGDEFMKNEIGKFDIFAVVILVMIICVGMGVTIANAPQKGTTELSLDNYEGFVKIDKRFVHSDGRYTRLILEISPKYLYELRNTKLKISIQGDKIDYIEYSFSLDLTKNKKYEKAIDLKLTGDLSLSELSDKTSVTVSSITGQAVYAGV